MHTLQQTIISVFSPQISRVLVKSTCYLAVEHMTGSALMREAKFSRIRTTVFSFGLFFFYGHRAFSPFPTKSETVMFLEVIYESFGASFSH